MMAKSKKTYVDANGYCILSDSKKYLHRAVYEDFHKLTLLPSAIIHHKDGNKLNNSIENLEMVNRSEHNIIHHRNKVNSFETINKMRESKLKDKNPMFGTGECGYYRVYKVTCPTCKQGFRWVYEYQENDKKKTISSVDFTKLESKVKNRGLDWFKIDEVI